MTGRLVGKPPLLVGLRRRGHDENHERHWPELPRDARAAYGLVQVVVRRVRVTVSSRLGGVTRRSLLYL